MTGDVIDFSNSILSIKLLTMILELWMTGNWHDENLE